MNKDRLHILFIQLPAGDKLSLTVTSFLSYLLVSDMWIALLLNQKFQRSGLVFIVLHRTPNEAFNSNTDIHPVKG